MRLRVLLALAGLGAVLTTMAWRQQAELPGRVLVAAVPCVDIHERADTGSPLVTQALWGWPVRVVKSAGRWLEVVSADGTSGWMEKRLTAPDPSGPAFMVSVPQVYLRTAPSATAPSSDLLYLGSLVRAGTTRDGFAAVARPGGGTGWLAVKDLVPSSGGRAAVTGDGAGVVAAARLLSGTPYLWGGMSARGVDCSGLAYVAYLVNGLKIPRDADLQFAAGDPVPAGRLLPGDLVFFALGSTDVPSHVGIYTGEGRFINARSRQGVVVNSLSDPYFARSYLGARRFFPAVPGKVAGNAAADGIGGFGLVGGVGQQTGFARVAEETGFDDH